MGLRCPEDFGLVSSTTTVLRCFEPPRLTTADLTKYELGAASEHLLIEWIKGKTGPRLIVREACGLQTPQARKSVG